MLNIYDKEVRANIKNSDSYIREVFNIPEGIDIKVHENTKSIVKIVIPNNSVEINLESISAAGGLANQDKGLSTVGSLCLTISTASTSNT